ncbi:hypothetical protein [Vibrio fluvialis]|nr:hypothetical protein [Vibrio fluvialis]
MNNSQIQTKFNSSDFAKLQKLASEQGVSVAAYLRKLVSDHVKSK